MCESKESQKVINYEKAEEIYAQFFEGYDRISSVLNSLHLSTEDDKKLVKSVVTLLDNLDTFMYESLLTPE